MIFHSEKRHSHKGAPSINHHPFGSRENGGRLVGSGKGLVAEVSVILKNTCLCFARGWWLWRQVYFFAFLLEHSGTSIISEVTNIKFSTSIYQRCHVPPTMFSQNLSILYLGLWHCLKCFNNLNQPLSKCVFYLFRKGEGVAQFNETLKKEEIEKEKAQRNS